MKNAAIIVTALLVTLAFTAEPVLAFQAPVITLDRVEVAAIQPFFAKPRVGYKDEKEPGKVESVGSILNLAYVLNIKNPNKEPVMLDEATFTTTFEGIEVNTAMVYEDAWIPGGKTNQLRVVVTNEALPTILALSVGSEAAEILKEMKTSPGAIAKKWWDTIGDFTFPIEVTGGSATFKDEKGKTMTVSFSGKWGKAAEKKVEKKEEKKK